MTCSSKTSFDRFATGPGTALPVIDDHRRLLGVITGADLDDAIPDLRPTPIDAGNLAHTPPLIHHDDPLDDAIQALGRADEDGLPVVDRSDKTIGWIAQRDILALYRDRLNQARKTDPR